MRAPACVSGISCGPPSLQGFPCMLLMASGEDRRPLACPVFREPPAVVGHLRLRRPPVATGFLMRVSGRGCEPPCFQGFPFIITMASGGDRLPLSMSCVPRASRCGRASQSTKASGRDRHPHVCDWQRLWASLLAGLPISNQVGLRW